MKISIILLFCALLTNTCFGQTKNADNYLTFYSDPNTAKYFKMRNGAYLDYYLADKVKFGDNEYYARIRVYSWEETDTAYFREDDKNYYHFDPKINSESIVLPKEIKMGQKWFERDSSWSYEVIGIKEKLKTPKKKYKQLIEIECVQLTGRDKDKSKIYHMFYAKGLGMVGSVSNGQLTSYLAKIKKHAKKGYEIGK